MNNPQRSSRHRLAIILFASCTALVPVCLPDTIALKDGRTIEGRITLREGEIVSIATESGIRLVRASDLATSDGPAADPVDVRQGPSGGGRPSAGDERPAATSMRRSFGRGLVLIGLLTAGGSMLVFVLVAAYASALWALAVLFIPGAGAILFACTHWDAAKRPVAGWLLGGALWAIGSALNP